MSIRISLSSIEEIVATVPYRLGFEPARSVVLVSLAAGRVMVDARCDLPPPERVGAAVLGMLAPVVRGDCDELVVIGYEDRPGQAEPLVTRIASIAELADISTRSLLVRAGRWWDLDDDDPPEGRPLPDVREVPAVADFVALGVSPHPDREALAAQLERPTDRAGADLADAVARRLAAPAPAARSRSGGARSGLPGPDHDRACRAWARLFADQGVPWTSRHARDVADSARALGHIGFRDGLIAWLSPDLLSLDAVDPALVASLRHWLTGLAPGRGPGPSSAGHRAENGGDAGADDGLPLREWSDLTRSRQVIATLTRFCALLPDEHAAPALCLLTSAAWWHGEGALARVAVDRALRLAPDYSLAQLLAYGIDIPPSRCADLASRARPA